MHLSNLFPLVATGAAVVLLGLPAPAQTLTDLQPGRNFVSVANFGTGRSENIDVGDVDNDGDLDVIVCNGGDGAAQANKIYINMGGLQAGTVGTFTDQSNTRFAGIPNDTSRDIEFVDLENDGDLDIYVANRGTTVNGGEVSRFYVNMGGVQGGTIGFYQEQTNTRWGTLISVPGGDQVFGGNAGPWRDFSCDCDFADLDDDGDNDLFHSTYGPNIDGTRDSRIFLNNGNGVFNEMWPWANAAADIATHTLDMDIIDFDGDFDLDIFMSSRNSQARVYMNNRINGIPGSPNMYHDITQFALIAQGATNTGNGHYEAEVGDLDGDGDMDVWAKNWTGFTDRILRNDGFTPGSGFRFSLISTWIKGDPSVDENEVDFGDYDNDGDLDVFMSNFSGTNTLYQSGLAQGLNPNTQGLYHRTGLAGGGSLAASFGELPTTNNGGTTLDGEWGDMDNDGDFDLLLANDGNQQNFLFRNNLGVPDTHAPGFYKVEAIGNKANGSQTVVHATVNDNSAFYLHAYLVANLKYSVNGGAEQTVNMFYQGGQIFRGVIPAQTNAAISYFIEVTDFAGNTGISSRFAFAQGTATNSWTNMGGGLAGISGIPVLTGTGTLVGGFANSLALTNARPSSTAVLFMSLADTPIAFKGGVLHTIPILLQLPVVTSGAGSFTLPFAWPNGLPGGFDIFFQYAIQDAAAVQGVSLSNYVRATAL